jgi:hypothetical protein
MRSRGNYHLGTPGINYSCFWCYFSEIPNNWQLRFVALRPTEKQREISLMCSAKTDNY